MNVTLTTAPRAPMGCEGFVIIEQERDPRSAGGRLADVTASLDHLGPVGFHNAVPMKGLR